MPIRAVISEVLLVTAVLMEMGLLNAVGPPPMVNVKVSSPPSVAFTIFKAPSALLLTVISIVSAPGGIVISKQRLTEDGLTVSWSETVGVRFPVAPPNIVTRTVTSPVDRLQPVGSPISQIV